MGQAPESREDVQTEAGVEQHLNAIKDGRYRRRETQINGLQQNRGSLDGPLSFRHCRHPASVVNAQQGRLSVKVARNFREQCAPSLSSSANHKN
jgi:hypothetical protein